MDDSQSFSIALLGPWADKAATGGGGSSSVNPIRAVTPAEVIQQRLAVSSVELTIDADADPAAAAELLFGDTYPSGKLPITFPVAMSDGLSNTPERYPGVDGKVYYDEELQVGYRWFQSQNITPLFPFGFGLSYTSFNISELVVSQPLILPGNSVSLQVNVSNTGDQPGAEVIQAYVAYPEQLGEPPKQLRAFQKVTLQAGESQTVELVLNPRSLAVWDTPTHNWLVHPGSYTVFIGTSSVDTPLEETIVVQ